MKHVSLNSDETAARNWYNISLGFKHHLHPHILMGKAMPCKLFLNCH